MDALTLTQEKVTTEDVLALLGRHFTLMRSGSPEESCHVMTAGSLADAKAQLLGARCEGVLLGIGALVVIGPGHGELKSMHTAEEARGRGVARHLLRRLIDLAKDQGLDRLSLETGTAPAFAPARALYQSHGFTDCPPFGDYVKDPLSVFMTRQLAA